VRNTSSVIGGLIPPGYCRPISRINRCYRYKTRGNMLEHVQLNSPCREGPVDLNALKENGYSSRVACIRPILGDAAHNITNIIVAVLNSFHRVIIKPSSASGGPCRVTLYPIP